MTTRYTPVLATLAYILSPDRRRVLMIHRGGREDDLHSGKFNGLGGKLEPLEDVISGICRELREEANIEVDALTLRGTVSWPGFGKGGEDWFGFIFRIEQWHGEPPERNAEGTLHWVDVEQIMDLPLWDGDRHFLPLVFADDARQFHGVMPYRDGQPVSWQVQFC